MSHKVTVRDSVLSGDPFGDNHIIDFEHPELYDEHIITHELDIKTAYEDTTSIPILNPLPNLTLWSPQSTTSSLSTISSPSQETFTLPIQWTTPDLMYLLTCLLPSLISSNTLIFSPPLKDIHTRSSPIHLRLYQKIPILAPHPSAYSKYAPIGTGRPRSKVIIAESSKNCKTAECARLCLARNFLSNYGFVAYMRDRYNLLTALYDSETATLRSLQRGMIEMLGVSESEWVERWEQLDGWVDGACVLEARVEVFLLSVGRRETEEWMEMVELVMGMGEGERGVWAGVYGDAAAFLGRVLGEMDGV